MKAKKYQNGGKAPEGKSAQERMYLEIRKDADRMKKEMQKKGMSEAEINKKLDAYMEKAMKQAQYSGKSMKSGGKVVKYQEGGANPTPTGRTLTPDEIRITGTSENQGYSNPYAKVNKPVTAKDVLEKTEMSRLTEALRKQKYSTANLSLGDMRKIAKTKGLYDDARGLAREDYQKWLAKNRK